MILKINTFFTIFILASSQAALSFEFNVGEYKLINGNDKICEDGNLAIRKNDLVLGSRYIFPNFKENLYKYSSDDKSCEYFITNINKPNYFIQELKQTCKKPQDNFERKTTFKTNINKQLSMIIERDQKTYYCILEFIK